MNRKMLLYVVIGIAVAGISALSVKRLSDAEAQKEAVAVEREPLPVRVDRARRGPVAEWIFAEGTARAVRREFLTFEQTGRVVYIGRDAQGAALREGAEVRGPMPGESTGQLIARVDTRDQIETYNEQEAQLAESRQAVSAQRAQLEKARADLDYARTQLERTRELKAQGVIAAQELDQRQTEYDSAQAAYSNAKAALASAENRVRAVAAGLNKAKIGLERTGIFAPFDGVLTYLNVREGDYVTASALDRSSEEAMVRSAAAVVIDPSRFEIVLELPPFDGVRVRAGQKAFVALSDSYLSPVKALAEGRNEAFAPAEVYSVTPAVRPGGRTMLARLRTTANTGGLRDGMYVSAWIVTVSKPDALLVPEDSLVLRDGRPHVFVADAATGTVSLRSLKTGLSGLQSTEVLSGITAEDLVVTEGRHRLVDGGAVRIISEGAAPSQAGDAAPVEGN